MRWNAHVILALCGLPVMARLLPGLDPLADGLVAAMTLCLAAMLPDFDRVEGLDQIPGYFTGVWRRTLAGCGVLYPLFLVARYVGGWRPVTPDLQLTMLLLVLVAASFVVLAIVFATITRLFGLAHRKLLHSLVLPVAGAAVAMLEGIPVIVPMSFVVGFASHVLADSLTPAGVYPLYPVSVRRVSLALVHTGGWGERSFMALFLIAFVVLSIV